MAKQYSALTESITQFIAAQKLYFVGTAAADGRVNISPKGMDSFRVISEHSIAWLNLSGSGNESAAHVLLNPRMTIMFVAFDGSPNILRLYGTAKALHLNDPEWDDLAALFPAHLGARQIFLLDIDLVQTSCGFGVPLFDYVGEREQLARWAEKKGEQGVKDYWALKNQTSIDGFPTYIMEKNT